MHNQREHWNELYRSLGDKRPVYDLWLDKYADILNLSRNIPVIDLGCGFGNETLYLSERGYKVISCDFSPEALRRLVNFIKQPETKLFDTREGLPFARESSLRRLGVKVPLRKSPPLDSWLIKAARRFSYEFMMIITALQAC